MNNLIENTATSAGGARLDWLHMVLVVLVAIFVTAGITLKKVD